MRNKKIKLPTFIVQGSFQELIELESLFVLLGYDKDDEYWAKLECERIIDSGMDIALLKMYDEGKATYFEYCAKFIINDCPVFKSNNLFKILAFIKNHQNK